MTYVDKANQYARDVVSGKQAACRWVRLSCKRHLDDLEASKRKDYPFEFDADKGEKICKFAEKMPHVKGKWAGTTIKLEPWQCFFLAVPFGWVRKKDGLRRFREIYAEIPRKNSKSTLGAIIGLYMLACDGEAGAEIYSGATSEKQAWEVFRPAKQMADKCTGFKNAFGIGINAKSINIIGNGSRFEPVIGKPGDGASPSCAIVDEYHEHDTPDLYDTMQTGMGARAQPMRVIITTAGVNIAGPCYEKRDQVCQILDGRFNNDEIFGILYTIDDGDEWTDLEIWKKANPNYGVSIFEDFLEARLKEAQQRVSRQNIIKCKHLNLWMNAKSAWLNLESVRSCVDKTLNINDFIGQPCFIGIDLASKIDFAEVAILFTKKIDEKTHYYAFNNHYLPDERLFDGSNAMYSPWMQDGWITTTDGNETDLNLVQDDIIALSSQYQINAVAYDPWQATQLAQSLEQNGANVFEYRHTVQNLSPPMKELEAAIESGRFHFNGDPVQTWMFGNVVARVDAKDNIFPRKELPENKIDGVIALLMAIGIAMNKIEPDGPSIYDSRGFIEL